ncbi:MAG: TetR/AcrR family transcriptional regulator [Bacteroidetes bacterium]|nr:TetR/AcrR family transcriptional regulator [Bacteroidota bacterium]
MPKIIAKKEDWINLGYKLFSEQGASGIIIEKMAKTLKVNKSSFYWHFETKRNFIDQLITYWINTKTVQIINLTNNVKKVPDKFKTFIALIYKQDPFLDFTFYLKKYAKKEQRIQQSINQIDNQRIEYANKLLQEIGYSTQEATIKAKLLHKHFIGYHETIRYKKQNKNYQKEVKLELNQFIDY